MSRRMLLFPVALLASLAVAFTQRPARDTPAPRQTAPTTARVSRPHALEVRTTQRWRVPLPTNVVGVPLVDGDGIYATTRESVVALRHDGSSLWSASVPGARVFAPRRVGDTLLVACDHGLVALSRDTGHVIWQLHTGDDEDARVNRPTLVDGVVLAMTDGGRVVALDPASGALRWESGLMSGSGAEIAGRDGLAVVVGIAEWAAFDVATGTEAWSGDLGFIGTSSPIIVDDEDGPLAVVATDNKLVAVGLRDGNLRWEAKAEQSETAQVPVLDAHGDLLVPDHWGRLSAYRVRDGELLWKVAGADGFAQIGAPIVIGERTVVLPMSEHGPRVASPDGAFALRPPAQGWGVARLPDGGLVVSTWGDGQNYLVAYDLDVGG